MALFKLPYSKDFLEVTVPDKNIAGVLTSSVSNYTPKMDQKSIIDHALDYPIGSKRLEDLAQNIQSVTIITSDHTRPLPSRITMPLLLKRIRKASPQAQITILIATGYHRATTAQELRDRFGEKIVQNETIHVHNSRDETSLINIGTLPSGSPLWLNKTAIDTDLLIAEGFIEPHFFAGFSGGRKSVLPGIAGYKTVLANHCAEFIENYGSRTGNLKDNPIHVDMMDSARKSNLAFILNVIINDQKEIIHAVSGDMDSAHQEGCRFLETLCCVKSVPSEIVITTNGGYPLDQNIYQSVKGMTAAEASCKENGIIIMVAGCDDGHGGESFYRQLAEAKSPEDVYQNALRIPQDKTVPDQWEYQILSRILMKHTVILVTDRCKPEMVKAMHLEHAFTVQEALKRGFNLKGDSAKVTIIPNGVGVIVTS